MIPEETAGPLSAQGFCQLHLPLGTMVLMQVPPPPSKSQQKGEGAAPLWEGSLALLGHPERCQTPQSLLPAISGLGFAGRGE